MTFSNEIEVFIKDFVKDLENDCAAIFLAQECLKVKVMLIGKNYLAI